MNNDEKILQLYYQGCDIPDIMQATHLSRSKVYQVIHNKKNGITVSYSKRGRKVGEKRLLSPEQEDKILQLLINTKPDNYTFPPSIFAGLWTRKNIRSLIGNEDIIVSDHTVLNYLKRFNLLYPQCKASFNIPDNGGRVLTVCVTVLQEESTSAALPIYLVYTYDIRGTYYFCCYPEAGIDTTENYILYILNDFLQRRSHPEQYTNIVCLIPQKHYLNNFRKQWKKSRFCKTIAEDRIWFNKFEDYYDSN